MCLSRRHKEHARPSCSKLTTLLVNVSLNISEANFSNMPLFLVDKNVKSFCIAKDSLTFSAKKISVFGYKVVKHLTSGPLNELV